MWRYLLLVVCAAPLGYVGYHCVHSLLALEPPASGEIQKADLDQLRLDLRTSAEAATKRGKLYSELQKTFLLVSDVSPPFQAGGSGLDSTLHPPLEAHAKELHDVRRFFRAHADLDRGDTTWLNPFETGHPYHAPLQERRDLFVQEQTLRDLRRVYLPGTPELRNALADYARKPAHNRRFLRDLQAFLRCKELAVELRLDRLPEELNRALFPSQVADPMLVKQQRKKVSAEFEAAGRKLDAWLGGFDDVRNDRQNPVYAELLKQVEWAEGERDRCKKCQDLVVLVEQNADNTTTAKLGEQLKAYAALMPAQPPAWYLGLARKCVYQFCEMCLPLTQELDGYVLLSSREVRAKRDEVLIYWKGKEGGTLLSKSGFNEFTLEEAKVARFFVGDRSYELPIAPTPRSKSAHFYNTHRRKVRWNGKSLGDLSKALESEDSDIAETRKRIGKMQEFFNENPTFSALDD